MDTISVFHSTWFDAILLAIIALSIVVSFFRGFLREAISLCSWVLGIGLALEFSSFISHHIFFWIQAKGVAYGAAFVSIVALVLIIGWLAIKLLRGLATLTGLGIFDRALGVVFGFFRGVLVSTLMVMLVNVTVFANAHWFADSAMKVVLKKPEQWVEQFVPNDVVDVSRWVDHKDMILDHASSFHQQLTENKEDV